MIENPTFGFYTTADNHVWVNAFDPTTGRVVWRKPPLLHSHVRNITVSGNRLVISSYALNDQGKNSVQAFDVNP